MKHILIFIIVLLSPVIVNAQMVLTPDGLRNANDTNSVYVRMDCPGKSGQDIYEAVYLHILRNALWKNNSVGSLGGTIISVEGTALEEVVFSALGISRWVDMDFRINFEMSDALLKLSVPRIWLVYYDSGEDGLSRMYLSANPRPNGSGNNRNISGAIFKKNGSLGHPKAKKSIEEYFNSFIAGLASDLGANITVASDAGM